MPPASRRALARIIHDGLDDVLELMAGGILREKAVFSALAHAAPLPKPSSGGLTNAKLSWTHSRAEANR